MSFTLAGKTLHQCSSILLEKKPALWGADFMVGGGEQGCCGLSGLPFADPSERRILKLINAHSKVSHFNKETLVQQQDTLLS